MLFIYSELIFLAKISEKEYGSVTAPESVQIFLNIVIVGVFSSMKIKNCVNPYQSLSLLI